MKQKGASYVDKNCTLNQEFSFAHPICRMQLNKIYNCHFTGCQIWDLFSQGAVKFFINKTKQSAKPVLRQLYNIAKNYVRTITGSNLRNILLQTGLSSVDDLHQGTVKQIKYEEIREMDKWRIPIIQ